MTGACAVWAPPGVVTVASSEKESGAVPAGTVTDQVVLTAWPAPTWSKVDGVVAVAVQPAGASSVTATPSTGAAPPLVYVVVAVSVVPAFAIGTA